MSPSLLANIGRIAYGIPFILFGAFHLMDPGKMAGMVPSWVPGGGSTWVVITGLSLIIAGLAILLNRFTYLIGLLLALLLLTFVVAVHIPNTMSGDANIKMMGMVGMLKDIGLLGAALLIAARAKT